MTEQNDAKKTDSRQLDAAVSPSFPQNAAVSPSFQQDAAVSPSFPQNAAVSPSLHDDFFFTASPYEMAEGIRSIPAEGSHVCLLCYRRFENGCIYDMDGALFDAERAAREHVRRVHGSVAEWLSGLDKKLTGLTETQRLLLLCMREGMDDRQTAQRMGISASTVRNHRFQMRERERQARIFLALMMLTARNAGNRKPQEELMDVKRSAVMVDERYALTQEEYGEIIRKYFPEGPKGHLTHFPVKEKRKIAVLTNLSQWFQPGVRYTEKQVTEILLVAHADHATLRRSLIEYGFMARERDCSAYWLKG